VGRKLLTIPKLRMKGNVNIVKNALYLFSVVKLVLIEGEQSKWRDFVLTVEDR